VIHIGRAVVNSGPILAVMWAAQEQTEENMAQPNRDSFSLAHISLDTRYSTCWISLSPPPPRCSCRIAMRPAVAASKPSPALREKGRRKGAVAEQLLTDQVLSLRARLHDALALGLSK
jgi:hypothetical protein